MGVRVRLKFLRSSENLSIRSSETSSSLKFNLRISALRFVLLQDVTIKSPVEISIHAREMDPHISESDPKKLFSFASSRESSVNVPGVITLTTSLFTIAL